MGGNKKVENGDKNKMGFLFRTYESIQQEEELKE
jgi:hypothetical protein